MTIQQLRTAMEAARTGSITQAAKNLYLSQPNASSMLRTLEQELGYELFVRGKRGVSLTPAGKVFYKQCKQPQVADMLKNPDLRQCTV